MTDQRRTDGDERTLFTNDSRHVKQTNNEGIKPLIKRYKSTITVLQLKDDDDDDDDDVDDDVDVVFALSSSLLMTCVTTFPFVVVRKVK